VHILKLTHRRRTIALCTVSCHVYWHSHEQYALLLYYSCSAFNGATALASILTMATLLKACFRKRTAVNVQNVIFAVVSLHVSQSANTLLRLIRLLIYLQVPTQLHMTLFLSSTTHSIKNSKTSKDSSTGR
jgi:hypothetical protein